jgi:hypothetical protein
MIEDVTEIVRRELQAQINAVEGSREFLEAKYGQVWDTSQLSEDFSVEGFAAPFVVVTRKADNVRGSLAFQHSPRFYFEFTAD